MLPILGRTPDHGFDEPLGLLSDCHRRIERFLNVLDKVAAEFRVGPLTPEAVAAVRTVKQYFAKAAPKHTADEEESLFPRMKAAAAARGERCEPIDRLEADHEAADALHAEVDELLAAWLEKGSLPAERARTLRGHIEALQGLYRAHIHVEDAEVFPLAAELLSPDELASVGREMKARRGL